jgi:hypothetical protein
MSRPVTGFGEHLNGTLNRKLSSHHELPLSIGRARLSKLLERRPDGYFLATSSRARSTPNYPATPV